MPDRIYIELEQKEAESGLKALATYAEAFPHPCVETFREKIADALASQGEEMNAEQDAAMKKAADSEYGPDGEPVPVPEQNPCSACSASGFVPADIREEMKAAVQQERERFRERFLAELENERQWAVYGAKVVEIAGVRVALDKAME